MPALVTIYIAMYPQDIMVIRARLESENIECFVQDELTLQTNPFYSNAIGGVRLQVKQEEAEHAKEVLREGGYVPEGEDAKVVDSFFNRLFNNLFVDSTVQIPWKKLMIGIILILIVIGMVYWISKPDTEEILIKLPKP